MCGICGYVNKKLIETSTLVAMNDTMYHRGPDDSGVWEYQAGEYAVGLAQRRLSILDLSELGHQPMISSGGEHIISFNGEVYNFREIRSELEEKGYVFKSHTDTEVILQAYIEWGESCFSHFNGMFAIAIFDKASDRLVLARDRMGKKPLYYYVGRDQIVFASELKPILRYPDFTKSIDNESIALFLSNKYIPAPKTIFADTYKVEPGTYLVIDCKKICITGNEVYWSIIDTFNQTKKSISDLGEAKKELRQMLYDSIERRMISDVPVGTFLSGGIDSTLVSAIAQDIKSDNIDSFTIGFYDEERNEAPYAKEIAAHLGTNHHEYYMSDEEILEQIKDLAIYFDEPFADSSQLPSMMVSKAAKEKVTVVLSGDGGDEFFCGYNMYDQLATIQKWDSVCGLIHGVPFSKSILNKADYKIREIINNRDKQYKCQLFIDGYREEAEKLLGRPVGNVKNIKEPLIGATNWQEKRMVLDMVDYIPNDILVKMDRAAMKYSLEVRNPILDYRILEWSFKVSHDLKYHQNQKKYLLKQLTYDYVPEKLLDRPKKGFGVPLKKWLRTVLASDVQRFSSETVLRKQGIFDPAAVAALVEKQRKSDNGLYSTVLWSFYVFQQWYNEHVESIDAMN